MIEFSRKELLRQLEEWECLVMPEYEEALIGISMCTQPKAVYNAESIIHVLMRQDEMNYQDAREHFEFNIQGSYVGDKTPIYVTLPC